MPELSGRALELYQAAHGKEHYERYNDKKMAQRMLMHGGVPPRDFREIMSPPEFFHRPEHDVESVFWTMFAILARVQPASGPQEEYVPAELRSGWAAFDSHEIPSDPTEIHDERDVLFGTTRQSWRNMFAPFPAMSDIADLLCDVSEQVGPEYALWEWDHEPEPDHLHEAVQRLIFQYLVDHPDDIALIPDRKRPVDKRRPNVPLQRNQIPPRPPCGEGVDGHRKNVTPGAAQVAGPSMSSDAATGRAPLETPRPHEARDLQALLSSRTALKRRGDDREDSTGGRGKRKKK